VRFEPWLSLEQRRNHSDAITHTRAGNATMVDSDGVLKWGPHNLLLRSEELDNAVWTKVDATVTANATVAPDGTNTADQITYTTTADARLIQNNSVSAGEHTFGIWVKGTAGETITLELDATVDQVTLSADWVLYTLTQTLAAGSQIIRLIRRAGDTALTVYFWGAHLYRSDLGGMVDNPDQSAGFETYVPTTSAARYLPRRGHHVWNGTAWVNEGLLHESEARTNLYTNSGDMDGTGWGGFRTTYSAGDTSPDGSQLFLLGTASETNSNGSNIAQQAPSLSAGVYTMSVFAKAGPTDTGLLAFRPGSNTDFTDAVQAWFDLESGTILLATPSSGASLVTTPVANIENWGDGVYRCSLTFTVTGTVSCATRHYIVNASGSFAVTIGKQVQLWGAQLEAAPTPSSYIPTNSGSTVTRSADVLTIPAANLPWPTPNVIGPELVTNGDFSDGTNDWLAIHGVISVVDGALRVEEDGVNASTPRGYQGIATEIGKVYRVTADLVGLNIATLGSIVASTNTNVGGFPIVNISSGTGELIFVAQATTTNILLLANSTTTGAYADWDNISVREINPLAVSIQMDGRVTYADESLTNQEIFFRWLEASDERILHRLETLNIRTGQVTFLQDKGSVTTVTGDADEYAPDILVPFNIAARHGSTFINGAVDGVALTADTTPVALPDLSATNLNLGFDYNGTIRTFRIWAQDIGDAGLVEATEPSLVPSLSLTFDGTENSFIVEDWS
jgi:hypothetical protein